MVFERDILSQERESVRAFEKPLDDERLFWSVRTVTKLDVDQLFSILSILKAI